MDWDQRYKRGSCARLRLLKVSDETLQRQVYFAAHTCVGCFSGFLHPGCTLLTLDVVVTAAQAEGLTARGPREVLKVRARFASDEHTK